MTPGPPPSPAPGQRPEAAPPGPRQESATAAQRTSPAAPAERAVARPPSQPQAPASRPRSGAVGPDPPAARRSRPRASRAASAAGAARRPPRPRLRRPAAVTTGRGGVTTETLIQAWPSILDAVKAQGRVAAIVIGNANPVSLDEAVLTLRFPRQGDVKGFVNSRYEDLLKQVINTMFGINIVVRAVTGGDTPPGGRPGPAPVPPAAPPAAPQEPPAAATRPAESAMPPVAYPQAPSAAEMGSAGGGRATRVRSGKLPFPAPISRRCRRRRHPTTTRILTSRTRTCRTRWRTTSAAWRWSSASSAVR